jgi:hypothetical protein
MKIAMIIVRTLLGLLFLFASVAYFLALVPEPQLSGNMKTFSEGLGAAGYFMTLLKTTELLCAIALLTGRFVPLALVILAPIAINIFFVHTFLERSGLPVALFVIAAMAFLAFYYRESFKPLLRATPVQPGVYK